MRRSWKVHSVSSMPKLPTLTSQTNPLRSKTRQISQSGGCPTQLAYSNPFQPVKKGRSAPATVQYASVTYEVRIRRDNEVSSDLCQKHVQRRFSLDVEF